MTDEAHRETHWAIRYTNLSDKQSHEICYGSDYDQAEIDFRQRPGPSCRIELLSYPVAFGAWQLKETKEDSD